jgi:hypothetical protein
MNGLHTIDFHTAAFQPRFFCLFYAPSWRNCANYWHKARLSCRLGIDDPASQAWLPGSPGHLNRLSVVIRRQLGRYFPPVIGADRAGTLYFTTSFLEPGNYMMRKALLLLPVFICLPAQAELKTLPIPDQKWAVQFDAPLLRDVNNGLEASRAFYYAGNAGRLNVSLHVGEPDCAEAESNIGRYRCFYERMKKSPIIVPATIKAMETPAGVQVMYMVKVNAGENKTITALNLHLLFMHQGKAGDFHVSVIQPEEKDVMETAAILSSVKLIERD